MDNEAFDEGVLCVRWIREWFEIVGNKGRDVVVKDYFHAPAEIRNAVLAQLVRHSLEERTAWDALSEIVQRLDRDGDPHPYVLAAWETDRQAGRRQRPEKRGPDKHANYVRNQIIASSVQELVEGGFQATRRNRVTMQTDPALACADGGSACDAVGVAFNMGYKAVEKIWFESAKSKTATDREFLKDHYEELVRWILRRRIPNK